MNKWDKLKVICPYLHIEYKECSFYGTDVCFGCDKTDFTCEYHKNSHCGHPEIFPFMETIRIFKGKPEVVIMNKMNLLDKV